MNLNTRNGKLLARATKTDRAQLASIRGMAALVVLNFDGPLRESGVELRDAVASFIVELDEHEAETSKAAKG